MQLSPGQMLRMIRIAEGYRQSDLARELDVTANWLSLVENDRRKPGFIFVERFAKHPGYTLSVRLTKKGKA